MFTSSVHFLPVIRVFGPPFRGAQLDAVHVSKLVLLEPVVSGNPDLVGTSLVTSLVCQKQF